MNSGYTKDDFCSFCGAEFSPFEKSHYPRTCHCTNVIYKNPLPVVVTMVPVQDAEKPIPFLGVLVIKRNIDPKKGLWAFPGGFMEGSESWQQASARELKEEVGLDFDPSEFKLFDVLTSTNGNLLIFNVSRTIITTDISFITNPEVSAVGVYFHPVELAFPTHTECLKRLMLDNKLLY